MDKEFRPFGIISGLAWIFKGIFGSIKTNYRNMHYRLNDVNPDTDTYLDFEGNTRDAKTNKQVIITKTNDEYVLLDTNFSPYRFVTREHQEEKNKEFKTIFINNYPGINILDFKTVTHIHNSNINLKGETYKDISTDDIYVIRYFEFPSDIYKKKLNKQFQMSCYFQCFMRISDGCMIRMIDTELFKIFILSKQYGDFIDFDKVNDYIIRFNCWMNEMLKCGGNIYDWINMPLGRHMRYNYYYYEYQKLLFFNEYDFLKCYGNILKNIKIVEENNERKI